MTVLVQEISNVGLDLVDEDATKSTTSAPRRIRTFSLSASNGVVVEVSNVGASIHRILLPKQAQSKRENVHKDDDNDNDNENTEVDDVVLGYPTALAQFKSKNPTYFNVIVGRVANRTANGIFTLNQSSTTKEKSTSNTTTTNTKDDDKNSRQTFQLATNNGPNHLHGGECGFSHCLWDAQIMKQQPNNNNTDGDKHDCVVFTLISPDGDQGYPGTIQVKATYSLVPTSSSGVTLKLHMEGRLLDNNNDKDDSTKKATPLNLAQHSYFNLAGHDCPTGVLDHTLSMPSEFYLPVDATSIPTRQVQSVEATTESHASPIMDWRSGRKVRDALVSYGSTVADLSEEEVQRHLEMSRNSPSTLAVSGPNCMNPNEPYGFDHNYIIISQKEKDPREEKNHDRLSLVGTLTYANRTLRVWTDAPGVQLYTANWLDGTAGDTKAPYGQWQGLCLETQTYPDGILDDDNDESEFAKGKCFILKPNGPDYSHRVEYQFEF